MLAAKPSATHFGTHYAQRVRLRHFLNRSSWSFIVRWLLNQLESQRNVNADVTNKLIAYMEGDHAKMIVVTEKVLLVMDRVLERLDRHRSAG